MYFKYINAYSSVHIVNNVPSCTNLAVFVSFLTVKHIVLPLIFMWPYEGDRLETRKLLPLTYKGFLLNPLLNIVLTPLWGDLSSP
jgi:hypothetical protein